MHEELLGLSLDTPAVRALGTNGLVLPDQHPTHPFVPSGAERCIEARAHLLHSLRSLTRDGRNSFSRNAARTLGAKGFTLIELLVVMAIIGVLLSIAAPRYFNHVEHARDNALRQSLAVMRDAIDKFHADTENYPASLEDLVSRKYLRSIPEDPHTNSRENWEVEAPPDGGMGVYDVHSSATGNTAEGTPLAAL